MHTFSHCSVAKIIIDDNNNGHLQRQETTNDEHCNGVFFRVGSGEHRTTDTSFLQRGAAKGTIYTRTSDTH